MNWDGIQSRWRRRYKGKMFRVKASELGGTTATDTKLAANRWFQDRKAERDRELALESPRPNELAYLAELENIQSSMKSLLLAIRTNPDTEPMLSPTVALLKHKEHLLKEALKQDTLPPLDDVLRNPIYISPDTIEEYAIQDAKQVLQGRRQLGRHQLLYPHEKECIQEIDGKEYIVKNIQGTEKSFDVEEVIDERLTRLLGMQNKMIAGRKQELGLVASEFDRGQMVQILKDDGIELAESKKLDYHIDQFLEYQQRRYATKKITAGRLGKIVHTIKRYKDWKRVSNVERIGTRDHIADYHRSLEDLVIDGKIKPEYANNLFGSFRMLVLWLAKKGIFKEYPHWLLDKGNSRDYSFPVDRQKPMTIPLEWVRRVLDATTGNPRLKLCILLTLNCGFGASEIGQLQKSEYDPQEGRIRHKRCKTQKSDNAPTVCYKLWNITKELLDQEIANNQDINRPCLLVNRSGKPLWYEYVADGKSKKSDNISCDFRRLITKLRKADPSVPAISYYQFRKTSASLIYNESQYRIYNGLWLAHSPRSVADRHYNDPDSTILDGCIDWLYSKIFGTESPSEVVEVLK